jgi:DNA-binding NtrC family response regulator
MIFNFGGANMANIIIMDDNRSTSTALKKTLERENHQVRTTANWQGLSASMKESDTDLVLIHQEDSQWTAFNQFKSTHQDIAAMIYVMRDSSFAGMVWIVKAVQEALAQMNKLDDMTDMWRWDTSCKASGISYFVPKLKE